MPPGIREQIVAEGGRVTFARFMELALTHPAEGYYSSDEVLLGPRGHFTTAPVLSPQFNLAVARLMEELVLGMLAPSRGEMRTGSQTVQVIELGGGEGQSARAILARLTEHLPELTGRLAYTIVEIGEGLRARQRRALARELDQGWQVVWAPTLAEAVAEARACFGSQPVPTVVLGNEFLDALPVHLIDVTGDAALECHVEVVGGVGAVVGGAAAATAELREVWAGLSAQAQEELMALFGTKDADKLSAHSSDGIIELRPGVGDVLVGLPEEGAGSCLLTIDYGDWFGSGGTVGGTVGPAGAGRALYRRTVRGYFRHQIVTDLYARVGAQDLTADVDFCALDMHGRRAGFQTVLYTNVAALLRGDSGVEKLERLRRLAAESLDKDREAAVLEALLDDRGVGGAFKVLLQVRE